VQAEQLSVRAMPTPKKMNTSAAASDCAAGLLLAVKAVEIRQA